MMNRHLVKLLALLAVTLPVAANAANPGVFADLQSGNEVLFFGASTTGGHFNDTFSFDVATGNTSALIDLIALESGKTGLKNINVDIFKGSTEIFGGPAFSGALGSGKSHLEGFSQSFSGLGAGVYTIDISGNWGKKGGAFGGEIGLVSAVPEPGTWAAMLVGLGMMLYVSKRRRASGL